MARPDDDHSCRPLLDDDGQVVASVHGKHPMSPEAEAALRSLVEVARRQMEPDAADEIALYALPDGVEEVAGLGLDMGGVRGAAVAVWKAALAHERARRRPEVVIDPSMRSGRPNINGTRLSVEAVVGMLSAGESVAVVADEYDITRADVLVACWYVGQYGMPGYPRWRKALKAWSDEVGGALWHGSKCDYDAIPDPPLGPDVAPPP